MAAKSIKGGWLAALTAVGAVGASGKGAAPVAKKAGKSGKRGASSKGGPAQGKLAKLWGQF